MEFDYIFYINLYNDLEGLTETEAYEHYVNHGKNENRFCNIKELKNLYEDFNYEFYFRNYPDLLENHIYLPDDLIMHYHTNGKIEGRICSFNELKNKYPKFDYIFYLDLYKDLENITGEEKALFHYHIHGMLENRLINMKEMINFQNEINNLINLQINELKNNNIQNYIFFYILTRSNKREKSFARNYNSIQNQKYDKNYFQQIVSYHNNETFTYLSKFKSLVKLKLVETKIKKDTENLYPYNIYLNNLLNNNFLKNDDYWIILLDDDDLFSHNYCLSGLNIEINKIKQQINHDKFLLFWRVYRCDQLTGQTSYQKSDLNLNIALCGFTFNSKYKNYFVFNTDKIAKVIQNQSQNFLIFWSDFIFTKIGQQNAIAGFGEVE